MTINFKFIVGWVLIFFGLGIIVWDISTSYYYFTGQKQFPQIFAEPVVQKQEISLPGGISQEQIQQLVVEMMGNQMTGFIPTNSVSDFLNLSSWSVFAFFLVYAGVKVASIGNDLLKKEANI
ncbi:MAG TPA: hypothetical protein PKI00_02685 [Candidatus Pacearchaeota archaeon]|nr:hypothetical protein [Candidatus Parcubacteria bacterium]HNP79731.1 hypothetical protein [Candidatus Pacearchaeota archaeon]HOC53909.1 hypothetical protein [Candidatus Pacearchaeota archaeon]HQM24453.1 hypothetical protein [Candidatus Pacearchaeota archaeon]